MSTSNAVATDQRPRCWRCGRVLAEKLTRPWELKCSRCRAANASRSDAVRLSEADPSVAGSAQ